MTAKTAKSIVPITDGSTVNYQLNFHPEMLKSSGFKIPSAIEGVQLKFGRDYVKSKIKHDVIDALKLKSKDEALKLIEEVFQAA